MLTCTSDTIHIPESWKAKRMAPRARSVHPLLPMNGCERSEAMVDQIAGQLPDASARAVKAKRAKVFANILFLGVDGERAMIYSGLR